MRYLGDIVREFSLFAFPVVGVFSKRRRLGAEWLIAAAAYPGFCSMKRLAILSSTPPGWDASPSQVTPRNLLGFPNNSPVPIYTPVWRKALRELSVLPKNTTQCPRPGLEPGPLDPGTSALTMSLPRV